MGVSGPRDRHFVELALSRSEPHNYLWLWPLRGVKRRETHLVNRKPLDRREPAVVALERCHRRRIVSLTYREALAILIWIPIAGCTSEAGSYEECLVEVGRQQSIEDARSLCREAFPAEEPFYVGEFYYPTAQGCAAISFGPTGRTRPPVSGFCGRGSAIDCGENNSDCQLVCRDYNQMDSTRIFQVLEVSQGLLLSSSMGASDLAELFVDSIPPERDPASLPFFLFSRVSRCEAGARESR